MPRAFPPAARRAQAVAARTYALYKKGIRPPDRGWDVTDDTSDQVFVGLVGPIDAALVRSAADTRGLVLTFAGAILPARYSSTCGGHTVPASEGLGAEDLPPLVGMPCRWCRKSRKFRWRRELPLADVVTALRLPGPPTGVEITRSARTGRALTLRFLGERPVERSAADVRSRLDPDTMLSVLLDAVEVRGDTIEFRGRGWGHGVGMCQMGATGMAKAGASPGDILAHYYPGALLSRIY
jgi:stage II sporulation protein D